MKSLFSSGYRGLSDSLFSGQQGSVYRSVGIDSRSEPGLLKVHQKLTKDSGAVIDELCKVAIPVSDGSKLWFSSESGKIWREVSGTYTLVYTLATSAFDLLTATFFEDYDASAQDSLQKGQIKPDGTKLITVGLNAGDEIHEYSLGTANDISTATYVDAKDINAQTINANSVFVRTDGLKMYVGTTDNIIYQYTLSTAWDVSTATYDSLSFNFGSSFSNIWFKSDGTKIYLLSGGAINAVTLTTPWDISTAQIVDFLVIAGGGGGGKAGTDDGGGGGGAGGYIETITTALNVGSYPVVVGDGGAGATTIADGVNGENSSAFGATAIGGGGGGGFNRSGLAGGSGGGGSDTGTGGAATSGQGNIGGNGGNTDLGGGGGGAGGAGQIGSGNRDGGIGLSSSISGSSVCRAGGGGGAKGNDGAVGDGTCGGGNGGTGAPVTIQAQAGTANTGGGGGGGGDNNNGAAGGSGVVIISYPTGMLTATGGTITTSGGQTIHTFTTSGTFEVTDSEIFIASDIGSAQSVTFNTDGTKMFVGSTTGVYQYTLATAWDVTTATSDGTFLTLTSVQTVSFDSTGTNLYVFNNTATVSQYTFEEISSPITYGAAEYLTAIYGDTEQVQHIVWAINDYVFKIEVSDLASWSGNVRYVGKFKNGDNSFHSMSEQNEVLYIADSNILASLSRFGVLTLQTDFNLPENENITSLEDFDIDLLVGTKQLNSGRVLRWDGVSISWTAEDDVYVKGGVSAFLKDDNYVYVLDEEGTIWFYNGERCEVFGRIPEVGDDKVKVNSQAVGYWKRTPIFGVSNGSGNPVLQGIYGLGKYSQGYITSLTLDFPVSTNEFSGVEIGAIIVDGNDLYASWKTATGQGVDKIDYTAKYASAYMETMALSDPSERHQIKTLSETLVPYFSLPASTGVTIGIKKSYDDSFTDMTVLDDTKRKLVKLKSPSVTDCANPQLRVGFTVNNNDAPEIEDVLYEIAPVGNK